MILHGHGQASPSGSSDTERRDRTMSVDGSSPRPNGIIGAALRWNVMARNDGSGVSSPTPTVPEDASITRGASPPKCRTATLRARPTIVAQDARQAVTCAPIGAPGLRRTTMVGVMIDVPP